MGYGCMFVYVSEVREGNVDVSVLCLCLLNYQTIGKFVSILKLIVPSVALHTNLSQSEKTYVHIFKFNAILNAKKLELLLNNKTFYELWVH